jgi:thioredoxin reductase
LLKLAAVRVLPGHRVVAAEGGDALERVRVAPLGSNEAEEFDCDALCIGHGLVPATEATRCFRAQHAYAPEDGGWVPVLDADRRTTVPRLYVAGDGGGVRGARRQGGA